VFWVGSDRHFAHMMCTFLSLLSIISYSPAITARELTCTFDGGDTYQLQSATYNLPRGGRVGLVGRNGYDVLF